MNLFTTLDILLVEDNPQDAELTIRALKKRNLANRLFVVEDGAEALDFIFCRGAYAERQAAHALKAVFLDLKLPKVDGLQVLQAIKAEERTRRIPVVIVTSSSQDRDVQAAYELGANSYVVKPVDYDAFQETIGALGQYWLQVNLTSQ